LHHPSLSMRILNDLYATAYSCYAPRSSASELVALPRSICAITLMVAIGNVLQLTELVTGYKVVPTSLGDLPDFGIGAGVFVLSLWCSRAYLQRQVIFRSKESILEYGNALSRGRKISVMLLAAGNFMLLIILSLIRHRH